MGVTVGASGGGSPLQHGGDRGWVSEKLFFLVVGEP